MSWAGRAGVIWAMASLGALTVGNGCSAVTVPPTPGLSADAAGPLLVDSGIAPDTSFAPMDSGALPPEDGGGTCMPGDVSTFAATWHPPVGPYLDACTGDQIDTLIAACFDSKNSTQATCDAWLHAPANTTCESCWAGEASSTPAPGPWAPFLYTDNPGQTDFVNVPGCVALADPSRTQCAHELQAVFECELDACLANCPVPMGGTTTAEMAAVNSLTACFQDADTGGCSMLVQQASACLPADAGDAGPSGFCYDAATESTALEQYFSLVCGHAPSEAGFDAGGAGEGGRDAGDGG